MLVDEGGRDLGPAEKVAAHRAPGQLHRAFSVFVFTSAGRLLVQRRATGKYHFAGRWSNSCCGHPRPGEAVADGGGRRLYEELGIRCELEEVGSFRYAATDPASGLVEQELDHLLVGVSDDDPVPDPAEVDAVRLVSLEELAEGIRSDPRAYTPWLGQASGLVAAWRRRA
ncbi:MAG: isopentenyl-diphosphate Delta-isomerase [Actinomycetota bacterium]